MQTWAQVLTRARGGCVVHRCQNQNPGERLTSGCKWRHAPEARAEDFGDFEKVVELSWELDTEREGSIFGARWGQTNLRAKGTTRDGGWADGKVIIERLCISHPYVETFNSKVIKGFVPELRCRYVFFVFRDSYVLCIYVMNILCTFHISVSWVWYIVVCLFILYISFYMYIYMLNYIIY